MNKSEIYKELHHGSTFILLLFSALTLGIYYVHYISKQTDRLNIYLNNKISVFFVTVLILTTYISVTATVFSFFYTNELFIELENLFGFISFILLIIWGFKARNRMNELMDYDKNNNEWFNGFWTFFLSPYYFNYKINCANEEKININEQI